MAMKVVWVLGSGFSQPLGGPTLMDLVSAKTGQSIVDRVGSAKEWKHLQQSVQKTVGLYENAHGSKPPWENPEEFLAYLDEVYWLRDEEGPRKNGMYATLSRIRSGDSAWDVAESRDARSRARKAIAAACYFFTADADAHSEKWLPHRQWVSRLQPQDTVITFNYDLVVECLESSRDGGFHVLLPQQELPDTDDISGSPLVIKLHGSVDWVQTGERVIRGSPEKLLQSADAEVVVAAPGPGKKQSTEGPFGCLWELAKTRLKDADVVVFVGYSFPKSDNQAKRELLHAIRDRDPSHPLTAHIVLGADTADRNVRRLEGMLRWALSDYEIVEPSKAFDIAATHKRATIIAQPLYTEDFLAVFDYRRLTAWCGYGPLLNHYAH